MAGHSEYPYDVFISHSPADREWVATWLLPHLEQAGLRVAVDYRDFTVGMPRIENIERAIEHSRRTIVVLTPNWLDSEWNAFEALLLRTMDPAARQRKLLPVLLQPCGLPALIDSLERIDLTVERHWDRELRRLTRDIQDVVPVAAPWKEPGSLRNLLQWKRWIRRYRRELRRGVAAIFVAWLMMSIGLQLPPFQPRLVWTSLGVKASDATQLARAGDVLLIGGNNKDRGCDQVNWGLWRSPDNGQRWEVVPAPLEFTPVDQGCLLADIMGFAVSPGQSERIYAATSDVGLLYSSDAGRTWQRTGEEGLTSKQLVAVTVDPTNPERVFVAAQGGGLFRSDDGGQRWQRLDRQTGEVACEHGQPLTGTLAVGALLATPGRVVVGTGDPFELTDVHAQSGLYISADGGRCWYTVNGSGRDEYLALAYAPTPTGDYVLTLVQDWWKQFDEDPFGIWRVNLTTPAPTRHLLWTGNRAIPRLLVEGDRWYVVTPFGGVVSGTLDVPAHIQDLPRVWPCITLACLDMALAPDQAPGPPLLLANGWVLRLQQGPWWRLVQP